MEIYKLSDATDDESGAVLKITKIKQAVKNPERVNVFVNDKYSFSLDVTQLLDTKIKVGQKISEEQLAEYKKLSEYGKLYQRTLEWVLTRPRSEKETRDYLWRKLRMSSSETLPRARLHEARSFPVGSAEPTNSSEDILELSEQIISRLHAKNYLNDEEFARWYVENRFVKKGVSRRRLKMELLKKGVSREIIERVMVESGRDEREEVLKIIAKKRAKYDDEKLIQYLCRQGFSYELVRDLVFGHEMD